MNFAEFEKEIAKLDFLNLAALEYVKVFSKIIKSKHEDLINDAPTILTLILLLQHSLENKNICIRLDEDKNDINQLKEIIAETYIEENRNYLRINEGESKDDQKAKMRELLNNFWQKTIDVINPSDDSWYQPFNNILCRVVDATEDLNAQNDEVSTINNPMPLIIYKGSDCPTTIYFSRQFYEETQIAKYISKKIVLKKGLIAKLINNGIDEEISDDKFFSIKDHLDKLFNEDKGNNEINWQKVAAATACLNDFTVITGGPGTGKTTTVVKLLFLILGLSSGNNPYIGLTAPTGKAANRMKESILKSLSTNGQLKDYYDFINSRENNYSSFEDFCALIPSESKTIHKMLGINPVTQKARYNTSNPLPYDVIIVDEASMIDLHIFYLLISALKPDAKFILLGDKDQLPSVEAGSVLADVCRVFLEPNEQIRSDDYYEKTKYYLKGLTSFGDLPNISERMDYSGNVSRLVVSRRFDANEGIGQLADIVNNFDTKPETALQDLLIDDGNLERYYSGNKSNVHFIDTKSEIDTKASSKAMSSFIKLMTEGDKKIVKDENKDKSIFGYHGLFDKVAELFKNNINLSLEENKEDAKGLFAQFDRFRILCSNRQTKNTGVEEINSQLDKYWHKQAKTKPYANLLTKRVNGGYWYPGLPVMITKNDYSLELFNGDIGIAMLGTNNQGEEEVQVLFQMSDGSFRYYQTSVLSHYELAYAMTIHKSQGSEAESVVVVTQNKDTSFLTREILYTGITRAKEHVTIVGDINLLNNFCSRKIIRSSNLEKRLISAILKKNQLQS